MSNTVHAMNSEITNSLALEQIKALSETLYIAHEALLKAEHLAGGPEPLSAYLGQSFSNIAEGIEELAAAARESLLEVLPKCYAESAGTFEQLVGTILPPAPKVIIEARIVELGEEE